MFEIVKPLLRSPFSFWLYLTTAAVQGQDDHDHRHRPQESAGSDELKYSLKSNQFSIWQRAISQEVEKTKDVETELKHVKYLCILCRSRMANVVLLPCRHLCFCSECDNNRRDACLICKICDTHRITSIKANLI
ncbi:hypothetical protein L1987_24906 [Smallanthus sonchifolius]|uniref:Uncharacterized protein n=1 Tax=Smallanthus sonchifolius TaxID=185202 RepID=A0ACB9IL32_9ASTR|nr:hypothetical protein L1987_24906 [Smallanthus sonchifolius]